MTASLIAQSLMALFTAAVVVRWRWVAAFLDDCSHCEGFIRAEEAKAILAMMNMDRRVA